MANKINPIHALNGKFGKVFLCLFLCSVAFISRLTASELLIGAASADITPALPVALAGQFNLRIAMTAETPLSANIVVLESLDGTRSLDLAIMVSCDLLNVPGVLLEMVRYEVPALLQMEQRKCMEKPICLNL